jgi:hypothetical protein
MYRIFTFLSILIAVTGRLLTYLKTKKAAAVNMTATAYIFDFT